MDVLYVMWMRRYSYKTPPGVYKWKMKIFLTFFYRFFKYQFTKTTKLYIVNL